MPAHNINNPEITANRVNLLIYHPIYNLNFAPFK